MSSHSLELMKLQRAIRALAPAAALAILTLAAAPVVAAGPPRSPPSATARPMDHDIAGVVIAANPGLGLNGIGRATPRRAQWSPRVGNWSGYDARFIDLDRDRFRLTQGGLETVVDGRRIRSGVDLTRRRVQLVLSTDF